jgi:hypothetical protein
MLCLGDVKALQIEERRKAQGIDKMVNPPLTGPASLKNVPITTLPGGYTLHDSDPGGNSLRPIYQVQPQLGDLIQDMDRIEARINQTFFVDLFLAITNMRGIQPRNEMELAERNAERLLQLGPVLESVQNEFQEPLIDNTFDMLLANDLLPPPPPELQGQPLKINYVGTLAQAQKAVELGGIEQLSAFIGGLVQAGFPNAADKLNIDDTIDSYATATGTPATMVVPTPDAERMREERAKAQAAQAKAEQDQMQANTAQMASNASLEGDSVLSRQANQ